MAKRKIQFVNFEYYHVFNRGVDKRKIFMDDRDSYRFIHDLYEFNDERDVINLARLGHDEALLKRLPGNVRKPRKLLVDILSFVLMPNHYHILIRQRVEDGISLYLRKLGGGYANYFNERYERSGALFQGRFKAVHVDREAYLRHLLNYIHANPLPLLKSHEKLQHYRWSSYPDYLGDNEKNFPSLISWDLADELALPRGAQHKQEVLALKQTTDPDLTKLFLDEDK